MRKTVRLQLAASRKKVCIWQASETTGSYPSCVRVRECGVVVVGCVCLAGRAASNWARRLDTYTAVDDLHTPPALSGSTCQRI